MEKRPSLQHWVCVLLIAFFTITSAAQVKLYAAEDTEPPTSSATLIGNWDGLYYKSPVEVSISATDNPSGQNHGVAYTAYRINSGEWSAYTEPFVIEREGIHIISYFSEDRARNPEPVKTVQFEINFNAPTPTPTQIPAPTQGAFATSTPTPITTPTVVQGVSPSVIPTQSAASSGQAYPASFPYYRSPTKTPTPTAAKVLTFTASRQTAPETISSTRVIFSPTPTAPIVNESVNTADYEEPPAVLGTWTSVNDDRPESSGPLFMLILAVMTLGVYIAFVYYYYSKINN
ncbi:hypothetical protein IPM65_05030 [Candidatus Roizmanbacteria bacterium]|nr:MAG: hypothetical protein IPM65_05030 [Candidatus Roizmanbacteria bacterium]